MSDDRWFGVRCVIAFDVDSLMRDSDLGSKDYLRAHFVTGAERTS